MHLAPLQTNGLQPRLKPTLFSKPFSHPWLLPLPFSTRATESSSDSLNSTLLFFFFKENKDNESIFSPIHFQTHLIIDYTSLLPVVSKGRHFNYYPINYFLFLGLSLSSFPPVFISKPTNMLKCWSKHTALFYFSSNYPLFPFHHQTFRNSIPNLWRPDPSLPIYFLISHSHP